MQSSFDQENQLIFMKQTSENKLFNSIKKITIKNLRELLKNQIDQ